MTETEPRCKECKCLYPVEYSKHQDYCDECFALQQIQGKDEES